MWNIIVLLFLLINFDFFKLTPLWDYETMARFVLSVIGLILLLFNWKSIDQHVKKWIIIFYLFSMFLILPSYLILNQSILDTLIASVKFYSISSTVVLYLILNKKSSRVQIDKIFFILIWVNFIIIVYLGLTNTSILYTSIFTGSVVNSKFDVFSNSFIIFGVIFYFISYIQRGKLLHLLFTIVLFFIPLSFEFQRMQFVITIFIFMLFVAIYSKKSFMKVHIKVVTILILFTIASLFVSTDYLVERGSSLNEAFNLFNTKVNISDPSTLARVAQIDYAWDKISENPIIGNGLIRSQNKARTLGIYFHYDDIGLIGLIYISGLFGLMLYLFLIYDTIKRTKFKQILSNSVYSNGLLFLLLFVLIGSFMTGVIFYNPYRFLTIIVLLICSQQIKKQHQQ